MIFKALRVRANQGTQFITDLRKATPRGFRGLPCLEPGRCPSGCEACASSCPSGAVEVAPLRLDLGKCVFCTECVEACPEGAIAFTESPRLGSSSREGLVLGPDREAPAVEVAAKLRSYFGRSLRLRQVSSGGCSGCEHELHALGNVNFDLQRYGIEWVASPRHADALVITGPLTRGMADAIRLAWDAMPDPRFVVAFGACAISGGLYAEGTGIDRSFFDEVTPFLYVAGCPPHPLAFANAVLDLLGVG